MLNAYYRIPDPFIAFNELDAEWVGEKSWTYKRSLPPRNSSHDDAVSVLAFDGLDTFATVRLNGQEILKSDNMFLSHRVEVSEYLKTDGDNILEIEFEPALLKARYVIERPTSQLVSSARK